MKNLLSLGVSAFLFMACSDTGSVFEVPLPGSLDSEEPVSSSSIVKKSSASKSKEDSESNKGEDKSEYNSSTGILKDLRDGQTYKTVEIGEGENAQIWMAENLNYAYKVQTAQLDSSSFCYDNESRNCESYGRMYLWSAAMDSAAVFSNAGEGCGGVAGVNPSVQNCNISGVFRSVCPKGWHLPTGDEWLQLIHTVNELKPDDDAGRYLKSKSGWKLKEGVDYNGEDTFGFNVMPGGRGHAGYLGRGEMEFLKMGEICFFWNADKYDEGSPGATGFYNSTHYNYLVGQMPVDYHYIRCLKD